MSNETEQTDLVESGMIAMVTSGMDCDCVEWENEVSIMPVGEAHQAEESEYAWADGPLTVEWMKPSEALKLLKTTRDRIASAQEDGHPWSV